MGEVQQNSLRFWCEKVVNDPEMLCEDPRGNKLGTADFKIKDGEHPKTFCNMATQRICRGMGYETLDGMIADQIHDYCTSKWIQPYGTTQDKMNYAHKAAQIGDLALLVVKSDPSRGEKHGHCTVVYPAKSMLFSGKWGVYCPQVANVGGMKKDGASMNGIVGANYAFTRLPDVFLLGKTIV